MKKLSVLLLAVALFACSNNGGSTTLKGSAEKADEEGLKVTAEVEVEDGKITSVFIDQEYTIDGVTKGKKEWKEDYGMSAIGKTEWYLQVEYLEEKLVGTDGTIELSEDGHAADEDILAGCTIALGDIAEVVAEAVKNAK